MDLSESFFTRYSRWRRKKNKEKENIRSAFFEDEIKSIQLFFSVVCGSKKILFRKGDGFGAVTNDTVFFPEKISFFDDKELNRKVYLHKALVASYIFKHKICYLNGWTNKKEKAFQVWALEKAICEQLKLEVPSYEPFFFDLFEGNHTKKIRMTKSFVIG